MKYKKMTPHELAMKTVKDKDRRKKEREEGSKQALMLCMENRERIRKRLRRGR